MDSRNLFHHFPFNEIPSIQTEQLPQQAQILLELLSKSSGYPQAEIFDSDFFKKDLNGNYFLLERCLQYLYRTGQLGWSPNEIKNFIHLLDVKDFFANSIPDFSSIDTYDSTRLANTLNTGFYNHCFNYLFNSAFFINELKSDYDQLARYAGKAFVDDQITREQIGTLLEIIEIKKDIAKDNPDDFLDIMIIPLLNEKDELTEGARQSMAPLLNSKEEKERFLQEIRQKPASEQCYYVLQFKNIETNSPENQLIQTAAKFQIMYKVAQIAFPAQSLLPSFKRFTFSEADPETQTLSPQFTYICFGLGARDALTKAHFGEHAKQLVSTTNIISIDQINRLTQIRARVSSVKYPGIANETSFHGVTACTFFLALHDELHRQLISSIPNELYDQLIHYANVVRDKTGMAWSKELWDCIDLNVDLFANNPGETQAMKQAITRLVTSTEKNEDDLKLAGAAVDKLFSAPVATEDRLGGLFYPSSNNDTMWLFLIDVFLNEEKIRKGFVIDKDVLNHTGYKAYYQFIENQYAEKKDELKNLTAAQQVASIKSAWFNLKYSADNETQFTKVKHSKLKRFYIQVEVNGAPLFASKEEMFQFVDARNSSVYNPENTKVPNLSSEKYTQFELINIKNMAELGEVDSYLFANNNVYFGNMYRSRLPALITFLSNPELCSDKQFIELAVTKYATFISNAGLTHSYLQFKPVLRKYYERFLELDILASAKNKALITLFISDFPLESFDKLLAYLLKKDEKNQVLLEKILNLYNDALEFESFTDTLIAKMSGMTIVASASARSSAERGQMTANVDTVTTMLDNMKLQRKSAESPRQVSAAASSATLFPSPPPSPSKKQNEGKKEMKPGK